MQIGKKDLWLHPLHNVDYPEYIANYSIGEEKENVSKT